MSDQALQAASVVLVDDDAAVRQALSLYLETIHGCHVTAVPDLKSLAAALAGAGTPPALLITDLKLANGESGIDAVNFARKFYGTAFPALLLTGDCSFSLPLSSAIPVLHVLTKPFEFDAFSAALGDLMQQRPPSDLPR